MRSFAGAAGALAAVVLVIAACSGGGGQAASSSSPLAPEPSVTGPVATTSDVAFATASPDRAPWSDPLLDVYAPAGARGLPLVVLLPAHGLTKDDSPAYAQLATAIAERGAIVAVANWSQVEDPPEIFTDPGAFEEVSRLGQAVAGCAVSFAAEHAREYGADPSRLVLAGEIFGANAASMVALGTPDPWPDCAATGEWAATGLVGVNGDWLALFPPFDAVGATAAEMQSPWSLLDHAPRIPVALVVSEAGVEASARCDATAAEWLVSRDPTGAMRQRLDEVGALDDDCVDLADEAGAMAAELAAHEGPPGGVVMLTNPDGATRSDAGAHLERLGPADLALLADTVIGLAD